MIWSADERGVVFKEEHDAVKQLFFIEEDTMFMTLSKIGGMEMK